MKTTPEQRRQWREIADAATPVGDGYRVAGQLVGTWKPRDIGIYEDPDLDNDLAFARGPMLDRQRFRNERAWREQAEADSLFAFSARTAITALLDDVAELEAEVDRLREKVSDMRSERVRADEKHKEEVEQLKAALGRAHRKLDCITLTAANGRRAGLGPHQCKCIVDEAFVEQADADLVGMVAK